jgi:Mce-associated membrane protein
VTQSAGRSRRLYRPLFRPVALGVATVILGGFGIFATVAGHGLRAAASSANTALVDRPATMSVERAITRAVEVIFSYSYADVAKTRQAAQALLTGAAIKQYDQLFALVEQQAPKEKLIVVTKVSTVGVELLTGNRARLLVFANQQDTKAGTTQASYSGAMFAVTAVFRGGHWLISNINTFTSPG